MQLPHFIHVMEGAPVFMSSLLRDRVGHAFTHFSQEVQALALMRTSKGLILFVSDIRAPIGQNVAHCIRFLVSTGKTMTSARNSDRKAMVFINELNDVTFSYSVTVLKGQSQSQYVGFSVIAEVMATMSRTAKAIHRKTGLIFRMRGFRAIREKPSSHPP
jgi:hypothetical protein